VLQSGSVSYRNFKEAKIEVHKFTCSLVHKFGSKF
jgi:hypothetical protein